MKLRIGVLMATLLGCSTTPPVIKEYEAAERRAQWEICKRAYNNARWPTVSTHEHRNKHTDAEVRDDLRVNRCHRVLKRMEF